VVLAAGHIRSGPISQEKNVDERFEWVRTSCGFRFQSRQEWPRQTSDIEVRYDAELRPLWAWKRLTIPGSTRADGQADIRRYELRTGDVFIKHRDESGDLALERLLPGGRRDVPSGMHVGAVVGPGRGVLTPWLQRAKLTAGERVRELVLDFRSTVEALEIASLERDDDRFEPSLHKLVRVYTFYGQETVFADADDVVIGDLAGMRPSDSLTTAPPPPTPMYGQPDPEHTP
jgi:hypothetical protein